MNPGADITQCRGNVGTPCGARHFELLHLPTVYWVNPLGAFLDHKTSEGEFGAFSLFLLHVAWCMGQGVGEPSGDTLMEELLMLLCRQASSTYIHIGMVSPKFHQLENRPSKPPSSPCSQSPTFKCCMHIKKVQSLETKLYRLLPPWCQTEDLGQNYQD